MRRLFPAPAGKQGGGTRHGFVEKMRAARPNGHFSGRLRRLLNNASPGRPRIRRGREAIICLRRYMGMQIRVGEPQPRLQSLRGKIADLLGVIEEGYEITVRF
jgi:hypothetical protein